MIQLSSVSKIYPTRAGARTVLDAVDLRVERGEKAGILGRNGAGKSTLIRVLSGAEQATSGRVWRGMSVSWPLAFGGAFQGSLSGLDNLKFICRVYGVPHVAGMAFVEAFAGLGAYLREPVKHYSAGMRARLAFAISMIVEFDCFLIDEIIAVGDAGFQQKCHHELFQRRGDRAMILVSHDSSVIRAHCDSFHVLHLGRLHRFAGFDEAERFHHRCLGLDGGKTATERA